MIARLPELRAGELYVITIMRRGRWPTESREPGRILHRGILGGFTGRIIACSTSEISPSHIVTRDPEQLPVELELCRYCWAHHRI